MTLRLLLLLIGCISSVPIKVFTSPAPNISMPQPHHGLLFTNSVTVWDEAIPLRNGMLGALVWGDGFPLKVSLDRADRWDLSTISAP